MDFVVLADHKVKVKNEKIAKYLDLARELKKLWNMRMTLIPNVVGALGMVPKGVEKRLEELEKVRIETIQITTLLRLVRILRGVLETCCHSDFSERPPANITVKNLQGIK